MRMPQPKETYTVNIDETETRFPIAAEYDVRQNNKASCGSKTEGEGL